VLTKFTAGTVLEESAKGGPLILGYDCDDMHTLATLTEFFATQGLPAPLTETTRKDYDSDWQGWVTFCIVMCKLEGILPADKQVLMAFMSQLILCQYATSTIRKFLSCIVTKHRQFGYPSPLMYREMGSELMGLRKNTSGSVKTKMRLTPIRLVASLPTTSLLHERDSILLQLGTLGAFQQSELMALDVCDWIVNRECDAKGQSCGTKVFIKRQKNDQEGKGRSKRIGWGGTLCLVKRIETYLHWGNLHPHAACLKWKDVALRTTPVLRAVRFFQWYMVVLGSTPNANASAPNTSLTRLQKKKCERAASRQQKEWACRGPCGAIKAVTKAMHTKRTDATTVQTQKTTRTCHGVSRLEASVRIIYTDSRKYSVCECVVACRDFVRRREEWTSG